jgi:hypothetical protein
VCAQTIIAPCTKSWPGKTLNGNWLLNAFEGILFHIAELVGAHPTQRAPETLTTGERPGFHFPAIIYETIQEDRPDEAKPLADKPMTQSEAQLPGAKRGSQYIVSLCPRKLW